ncbi:hypothetical protein I7Z51_002347 [Vibrio parahaemolyticus]|uniref:hypothetical protein n=1 Tax=Vibrio TaxID=662 RepID=UPI001A8CC222|nr:MULTISPECIES: hypothetical protein [Vibrio]EGQ7973425.1 hypothetical protein [Vibrio parahaemolyticus]MBO0208673.1 hypothetical protein [Vibrio sp. Vb0877]MCR9809785.1 hypothetical protein [Vibrio parahaemolyticus]
MLGFIDFFINLGLAVFVGLKVESVRAAIVFLCCYVVVTLYVKSKEKNDLGVPACLFLWGAKEAFTLLLTVMLNWLIDAVIGLFPYAAKAGQVTSSKDEFSYNNAPECVQTILMPNPDVIPEHAAQTESFINQLETYSNAFGLTAVQLTFYVYLTTKVVWFAFKTFQYRKANKNSKC